MLMSSCLLNFPDRVRSVAAFLVTFCLLSISFTSARHSLWPHIWPRLGCCYRLDHEALPRLALAAFAGFVETVRFRFNRGCTDNVMVSACAYLFLLTYGFVTHCPLLSRRRNYYEYQGVAAMDSTASLYNR